MDEKAFLQLLNDRAASLHINPFLLLSGLEALYTFREVPMNALNMDFLDSLVLTLFTLRIGDQFHGLAEEQLTHERESVRMAALRELEEVPPNELEATTDPYLRSFASVMAGKSPIRRYHEKALQAAAHEIAQVQQHYGQNRIGTILIGVCKNDLGDVLPLASIFSA